MRELRYFIAVAEEGTFTAAAERLRITQQSVSAAVRALERRVGVALLERSGRGVRLTAAGEEFLTGSREIVAAATRLVSRTRRVADRRTLRIGYAVLAAAELTTPLLVEVQRRDPELTVQLRLADYDDPSAGLRSGEVDLALVRRPVSGALAFEDLFREPRVAVLSADHPMAGAREIGIEDLAGCSLIADPGPDLAWRDFWMGRDLPGDLPGPTVTVDSFEDELALVALGRAVTLTSASAVRLYPRPGVAYVPVRRAAPCTFALAWSAAHPPARLTAILEAARFVRDRARADGTFTRLGWLEA